MSIRPPASLEVHALSHRYPGASVAALDGVGFRVAPGERVGLLGPNGAGKSTLMRLMCGYLPVQRAAGTSLRVGDIEVAGDSLQARRLVGYLPEQVPLYVELRVREHLDFRAAIKGVRRKQRAPEVLRVAERTGLSHMLEVPILQLSRGYRQRVGIADALLGAPPLVVLDEPTVGLDPNQVLEIRAMLRALGGTQTLVFSSHILAEVEALCDRVVILAAGRCVADEAVAEALRSSDVIAAWAATPAQALPVLTAALRTLVAAMGVDGAAASVPSAGDGRAALDEARILATALGLTLGSIEVQGEFARVQLTCPGVQVAEALALAIGQASAGSQLPLARLELGRRRLEQRFARLTGAAVDA